MLYMLIFAASASATTESWMVGNKNLTGTKAVSVTAHVDEGMRVDVPGSGITVLCFGSVVAATNPEIIAPNKGSAQSMELTECKAEGGECTLGSSTIKFLPVTAEATLDGTLAVREIIKPKTKNVFTTIKLEGSSCVFLGTQPVTGKSTFLAPSGQDESTLQLFRSAPSAGELKVGTDEAILSVSTLVGLVSGETWSFL
jgi:hypothetical protein